MNFWKYVIVSWNMSSDCSANIHETMFSMYTLFNNWIPSALWTMYAILYYASYIFSRYKIILMIYEYGCPFLFNIQIQSLQWLVMHVLTTGVSIDRGYTHLNTVTHHTGHTVQLSLLLPLLVDLTENAVILSLPTHSIRPLWCNMCGMNWSVCHTSTLYVI